MSTDPASPGPTNHDRSAPASPDRDAPHAKIIAVESATSLSHSLAPRQAHITPLALFSDHALLGPLGASLLPRSPPPPLTPHYLTNAFVGHAGHHHQHVGPAGLPLVSPTTAASARMSPPAAHQPHGMHAPAVRARRDSVSSVSSPTSSLGHAAPAAKRTRKTSLPADHHHPYRRRTSSSSTSSSSTPSPTPTPAPHPHPQIPIHQLSAAPARNRHPKHLTLPTSGPHASLPTTTQLYSSATTFTACATAIMGAGARKRPRAISTPATFAALRGHGPEGVAVGPIEAWRGVASARAFLTRNEGVAEGAGARARVRVKVEEGGGMYLV